MSKYRIYDQQGLNYLTLTVAGRVDLFTRQRYRDIVVESLKHCQEHKGLHIIAYVIMGNHLHLVARTEGHELSHVLRDFKKFTANQMLKSVQEEPESRREWLLHLFSYFAKVNTDNRHYQVWQCDNHPIGLWSLPVIWQEIGYTHENPVRAGLVARPEHYLYSSAGAYAGLPGLLEVELMEPVGPVLPLWGAVAEVASLRTSELTHVRDVTIKVSGLETGTSAHRFLTGSLLASGDSII